MNLDPIALYIKDNTSAIRVWAIEVREWDIVVSFGQLGGAMQEHTEKVPEGKAGRSRKDQILLYVASAVAKKRDMGYRNKLESASFKPTNLLSAKKPMLAKKYKDVNTSTLVKKWLFLQFKYDGNRCMMTCRDGKIMAYTRKGKLMHNLEHITSKLKLPDGVTVDGEIYCHGVLLQTLRSWITRKQPNTMRLEYMIYDIVSDKPYEQRLVDLGMMHESVSSRLVPTVKILYDDIDTLLGDISVRLHTARGAGYEGLMIRHGKSGYEDGKRSASLLKVKAWLDADYTVVDVIPSADGWGVLVFDKFNASAPGSVPMKIKVLENKEEYIGRKVKLEFANYTEAGVPFQPTAVCFL
jgi:hypothetical protein